MALYTNAAEVLPSKLLAEVQKHWNGLLWIPKTGSETTNELAIKAIQAGIPADAVAMIAGISRPRVYQIAGTLGDANPYRRRHAHVQLAHHSRLADV